MQLSSSVFTVGSVLSRAFAILKQNPVVFFTMAVIAVMPGAILNAIFTGNALATGCVQILNMVLSLAIQGAIAYTVFMVLKGGPAASINDAVSKGMARLGALILASLLMGIGVFVGMMLLIIPGIFLLCVWAVTIPACVVEGRGPLDSIKRSEALTKGYRWTVFGIALTIMIITWVIVFGALFLGSLITGSPVAGGLLAAILSIPLTAFSSVAYTVMYYDLRMVKEDVSIDNLANVFD